LKQEDALSPLLFNFALEYAIRKVQENNLGLDMNGTHQVLTYADDVNLQGDDIRTIERNTDMQTTRRTSTAPISIATMQDTSVNLK